MSSTGMYWSDCTLRLIRGKPCPGAGGLAGRGPFCDLVLDLAGEGEAFLLNGFSLQIRLLCDWVAPEANGLGVVGGRGGGSPLPLVPELRLVCGVAGAELAFEGMGEG